ncbi:OLC1v1036261C1 [Oldenlandia corymbosa var. corymbosa]|uniref:OLC1v1036261C1 n=1 Tax=Oldenlandia corymbosa var. corymbosa TaxID=529605 RepID=A0AAV1CWU3_OLDCO|nr:OLC1v1036261C1 [Oldenlandia corymbosa var. corymbosa]
MSPCYEGELDWELSQTEWNKFQETLKELEQRVEQIQQVLQKLNEISERKEEQFSHQNLVLPMEVKEVKEKPEVEMQPPPYQKLPPYVPPLPFPLRGVTKHTSSSGVKNSAKQKVVQQDFSNPLDEELCLEGLFPEEEVSMSSQFNWLHRSMVAENHSHAQPHEVECIHSEEFATWFGNNVESLDFPEKEKIFEGLKLLARGPEDVGRTFEKFVVNGFRGHYDMQTVADVESYLQSNICDPVVDDENTDVILTREDVEGDEMFLPTDLFANIKQKKEKRVDLCQWISIVEYWNKEKTKERSEMNRKARMEKELDHCTGRTPFAQKEHELQEQNEGCKPNPVQMFDASHNSRKGSKSIVVVDYLVMGPDKPGRVRMFGQGVTPSDVWGEVPKRKTYRRIILEQRAKLINITGRLEELEGKASESRSHALQDESQHNSPSSPIPSLPSFQVDQYVYLKTFADPLKPVAKGRIESLDPSAEVGGLPIGVNWCQVYIEVIIVPDAPLIRGYNHYVSVQDAHGDLVTWPLYLSMRIANKQLGHSNVIFESDSLVAVEGIRSMVAEARENTWLNEIQEILVSEKESMIEHTFRDNNFCPIR